VTENVSEFDLHQTSDLPEIMPLTIYLMLFTGWTFGNFTELHYNFDEDVPTLQVSPSICQVFIPV